MLGEFSDTCMGNRTRFESTVELRTWILGDSGGDDWTGLELELGLELGQTWDTSVFRRY